MTALAREWMQSEQKDSYDIFVFWGIFCHCSNFIDDFGIIVGIARNCRIQAGM
jgi:hypothetical protein